MNKPTFEDKQKTVFGRLKYLRSHATKSELVLKEKLSALKYKYIFQKSFIKGNCYAIADFYLPHPYKLCIEVDGGYHNTEEKQGYDAWRDRYLTNDRGLQVLRLTNEVAETITLAELKSLIKKI